MRRFYTVPGESFLEVLDAAGRHPDTSLVSTRHESGVSFMAEARGVGASNLAMHQARAVGRTAGSDIGPVDLAGFARSLGVEGHTVTDLGDSEPAMRWPTRECRWWMW